MPHRPIIRGMRNTTFYWFRLPQGLLRGAATPLGMVSLAKVPLAWEAFDQWHFQPDDGLTIEGLAERLRVSPRSIENLLDRARQAFILQFVHLVSPKVGVAEQMDEEVGLTRELLEKALARCWKDAWPRNPRAQGRKA